MIARNPAGHDHDGFVRFVALPDQVFMAGQLAPREAESLDLGDVVARQPGMFLELVDDDPVRIHGRFELAAQLPYQMSRCFQPVLLNSTIVSRDAERSWWSPHRENSRAPHCVPLPDSPPVWRLRAASRQHRGGIDPRRAQAAGPADVGS